VFSDILDWDGDVVLGGDFNVTIYEQDRHCRGATPAELRLAETLKACTHAADLKDCWEGRTGYTWCKGRKMSKLDRIYTRLEGYEISDTSTNWSFTQSDHACVKATFKHIHHKFNRNDHVKLDDKVVTTKSTLLELREY
jgi:endonuclease/exonuclease/phosphatase family metal-dependent hydrolase